MPHTHSVADDDLYFVIDPTTREIDNGSKKVKLIQYDHNSEMLTFELSRFVEGHDMSLCDSIRVNYININKSTREQRTGTYQAKDLVVDDSKITFTWLISRNATQYIGPLNFLIKFMCMDENDFVTYEWHTDIFKYVSVSAGMNNEESIEEEYPDILEQWKNEILTAIPPSTVPRVESFDFDNMVNLRDIDSGSYILYGKFKPHSGSDTTLTFEANILVNILKGSSISQVQAFYPNKNCIQYLKITDDSYERSDVYLNDLATKDYVDQIDIGGIVRYDRTQELSENEKQQARDNIGFDSAVMSVMIDVGIAPVILDEDGTVLVDDDNSILINS